MTHRWYTVAIAVLVAITFFYSTYQLDESPPTWFDEGTYIQAATSIADRGNQVIQVAPGEFESTAHITGGYPFLAPVALSLKLFGDSLFAARLPMVLFILLFVIAAWFFIYQLFGPREALSALVLTVSLPLVYGFGKNVLGEVPGMFYTLLALYALWRVEESQYRERVWYLLAGLSTGLAVATKPIFFLLPLAILIVLLVRIRTTPLYWREIGFGAVACIVPLILWAYLQFGADSLSSIVSHYVNPYAESNLLGVVGENLWRLVTEATPLYTLVLFGVWVLSIGVRCYRKIKITSTELAACTFSLLIILAYLRTAGWYRYLFEALVLSLIFLPHALNSLVTKGFLKKCAPAVLIAVLCLQVYQLNVTSWVTTHYTSTQTKELETYFGQHPIDDVLVFNAPEAVLFLKTDNYYQYFDIDPTGGLAYGKSNLKRIINAVPAHILLSPGEYSKRQDLFEGYIQSGVAGGYLLLTRKEHAPLLP